MQQVPYRVPPYFFVAGRCLPLAGLFLALMLAAAPVAAQQTTLVTITAVGVVGDSGLVEMSEGEVIVFELTRTGDSTSELPVTVFVEEAGDGNQVSITPYFTGVSFPADHLTVQLRVATIADNEFEEHTTVTATVQPADAGTEGGPRYYDVESPGSATVLVLDDDIPEMRVYVATTQVRINEGRSYSMGEIILEADERPHDRSLFVNLFTVGYRLKDASASVADVSFSFGETSIPLTETVSITERIPGSDFTRVEGRWRLNYRLSNDFARLRLIAEDDDQMEGDETLVLDLRPGTNSRISIISSLSAVILDGGEMTTPDTIITIVDNDFVTIALDPDEHPDNPEVAEGEEIVFELTRPGDPTSELTVTVAIDEPQDADRVLEETAPFEKTVVFPAGASTTQLRVRTVDDAIVESNATVTAMVAFSPDYSASPGDDEYYNASLMPASVLVLDDETTRVSIIAVGAVGDSGRVEVVEGDQIVFELTRKGALYSSLTVMVETFDDGEVLDDDGAPVATTVVFLAGRSTKQLVVTTFSDNEFEEHTAVTATVLPSQVVEGESGYYVVGSSGSASALVLDDDFPEMRIYVATTQMRVSEGSTYRAVVIAETVADELPRESFGISFFTVEGDAEPGADYNPIRSNLEFHPSSFIQGRDETFSFYQQRFPVPVVINDDDLMEGDEQMGLLLSRTGGLHPAIVIDAPLHLPRGSSSFAHELLTIEDSDFVTITAVGAVGPSGLVEVVEGGELVFELKRTGGDLASPLTVVVGIDEAGGDILADSVRSTEAVVFPANVPTARLAVPTPGAVRGDDEDVDFEPHTTVTVVIVAAAVAKEDPGYYVAGSPGLASVLVRDNDVPGIDIYAASTRVSVSEGSNFRLRVIVEMLYDEGPRIFDSRLRDLVFGLAYSSESRSARFREDFEPVNDVVEIFFSEFRRVRVDGGVTFFYRQVVEFPALVTIDDDLMEGGESLLLKMERSANLHPQIRILSTGNRVTLTIEDNDFVTIATDPDTTIATDPDTALGVVAKGTTINFVLTRPAGDLASELPVTVEITEVGGTAPSTQTVVFPEGMATTLLTVPTVNDEGTSSVTAVVLPQDPPVSPPERTSSGKYYNAAPTPASVLVRAVRQFSLAFQSADRLLRLNSGESTSVYLVLDDVVLKPGEGVEVKLELASTSPTGVSIDPEIITFTSDDSTQAKVTLRVSEDASAGTFILQVAETATTALSTPAQGKPLGNLSASQRRRVSVPGKIRPAFEPVPAIDEKGDIADDFIDAVENLAPGAIATTGTDLPVYILVPGIGAETAIDAAALLRSGFSRSLGACVVRLAANSVVSTSTLTLAPGDDCIPQRLEKDKDSRILLSPYRSVLYWVGLDADDNVAEDAKGDLIQLGDPRLIYIAPPVGFVTSSWLYDRNTTEVVVPLEVGVDTGGGIPVEIGFEVKSDGRTTASTVVETIFSSEGRGGYRSTSTVAASSEVRITELNGVAFRDGVSASQLGDSARSLVATHRLYSLGNDRISLVAQDGPLPTSDMEGFYDGPFLVNTPKTIDFEPGSDVTIYRYSSETRVFEMLGQASSVISVTIEASTGRVVIETLPEGTTLTELTYPSTSSSIFEIVVDPADGTTSIEVVTRTRNIRTFAVDSFPLSKGADAFTDGASTVTLVSNDEIQGGPYATHSGGGSSVFAVADLFPALSGMVGGVLDYVVKGGSPLEGGRAAVMIEFADDQEVDGSVYHVYQRQSDEEWGWAPFVVDDANRIYSALKPCPVPSASRQPMMPESGRKYAWYLADEGLGTDHRCVLVEFKDGGLNDADQTANAFAYSTGAFATQSDGVGGGGGGGGGAVALVWLLALTLIVLLASLFVRQRGGRSRETGPG